MKQGQGAAARPPGFRPWIHGGFGLWLGLVVGCAGERPALDRTLRASRNAPSPTSTRDTVPAPDDVRRQYVVRCPDVLDVRVEGRPDLTGRRTIGPDGRIDLGTGTSLRVEGRPVAEVARLVAAETGVAPERVSVQVAAFNSQQVYLFGQGVERQRAVSYEGPETVTQLLRRVGGVTPGAAPDKVFVVRAHIAEGRPPETFHIDVAAVTRKRDSRTDIHLQPYDQVYVGEMQRSTLARCVAPCLRPLYEALAGLRRTPEEKSAGPKSPPPEPGASIPR